jgi:hypothetical protein
MSLIADVAAIGSAILVTVFSLWMLKQLFTDKN